MCLFIHTQSIHDILWLTFTVKKNPFLFFDNHTEKFSLYLKIIDSNPIVGIISPEFKSAISLHPVVFFNDNSHFFNQIHLWGDFPPDVFCEFKQDFFRVYATSAVILLLLWIIEKLGLVTKDKRFYNICRLLSTFIYFIK